MGKYLRHRELNVRFLCTGNHCKTAKWLIRPNLLIQYKKLFTKAKKITFYYKDLFSSHFLSSFPHLL